MLQLFHLTLFCILLYSFSHFSLKKLDEVGIISSFYKQGKQCSERLNNMLEGTDGELWKSDSNQFFFLYLSDCHSCPSEYPREL